MSCLSCFGIHTSPGSAIRCYEAYKATDQYLYIAAPRKEQRNRARKPRAYESSFWDIAVAADGHGSMGRAVKNSARSTATASGFGERGRRRAASKRTWRNSRSAMIPVAKPLRLLDNETGMHSAWRPNQARRVAPAARGGIPVQDYGSRGLVVVNVGLGEDATDVRRWGEQLNIPFPLWLDPDRRGEAAFRTRGNPSPCRHRRRGQS
jgi:hypothetical protein